MLKWSCNECAFTAWAPQEQEVLRLLAEHIGTHYGDYTWGTDQGVAWKCQHCPATGQTTTRGQAATEFRTHLRNQHRDRFTIHPAHVAEEIDYRGSILVDAQSDPGGVESVRSYLRSAASTAVVVTSQPATQIAQLQSSEPNLPDAISLITTHDVRDENCDSVTLSWDVLYESSVGVNHIEAASLVALGESIKETLDDHLAMYDSVCIEVGILAEMIQIFDVEKVFKFVTTLGGLARQRDAFIYYVLDTELKHDRTLYVLQQASELVVTARGPGLIQEE